MSWFEHHKSINQEKGFYQDKIYKDLLFTQKISEIPLLSAKLLTAVALFFFVILCLFCFFFNSLKRCSISKYTMSNQKSFTGSNST